MYTLRKERNFIVSYDDEGTCCAKFDILTCQYYDENNQVSVTKPRALYKNRLNEGALTEALNNYIDAMRSGREITGSYSVRRAQRFEQFVSVGLIPDGLLALDTSFALKKDLVQFCIETYQGYCGTETAEIFNCVKQYGNIFAELSMDYKQIFYAMRTTDEDRNNTIIRLLRVCQNEYVLFHYNRGILKDYINQYINMQMFMYKEVSTKPNFLTNFCITSKLYDDYRKAHYDEILRNNNNKPWLYFENETFTAYPLVSRAQFHDEASQQHNCVERMYMERVEQGRTYIVVIRRKSRPNESYITCEVSLNHEIYQYLTRFNCRVNDRDALDFQALYQAHLKEQA